MSFAIGVIITLPPALTLMNLGVKIDALRIAAPERDPREVLAFDYANVKLVRFVEKIGFANHGRMVFFLPFLLQLLRGQLVFWNSLELVDFFLNVVYLGLIIMGEPLVIYAAGGCLKRRLYSRSPAGSPRALI